MKNIYVNENVLKEAVSYLNNEITFFGFLSHVKVFLKQLLNTPLQSDVDDYLKSHKISKEVLLKELIERGIVEKETKIDDKDGKDKFVISYKIPKKNFERKIRRLYASLFEKNEIKESKIYEDGATSCGSAMQGGGINPDAGQYTTPLGKVQRRKIYITNEQSKMLKETNTQNAGNYQYDVPMNFNNGKDPAYDHENIMLNSFQGKKKGIRKKINKI